MNAPDREECYVLDDSEVKMTVRKDPKILNAVNFTIVKEDHTVGNLLVSQLLEYPDIRFAGYRIPHPLEYLLLLKVQTDGERDPIDATKIATDDRLAEIDTMKHQFYLAKKIFDGESNAGNVAYDGDEMR